VAGFVEICRSEWVFPNINQGRCRRAIAFPFGSVTAGAELDEFLLALGGMERAIIWLMISCGWFGEVDSGGIIFDVLPSGRETLNEGADAIEISIRHFCEGWPRGAGDTRANGATKIGFERELAKRGVVRDLKTPLRKVRGLLCSRDSAVAMGAYLVVDARSPEIAGGFLVLLRDEVSVITRKILEETVPGF
jgi:hypothetical protein